MWWNLSVVAVVTPFVQFIWSHTLSIYLQPLMTGFTHLSFPIFSPSLLRVCTGCPILNEDEQVRQGGIKHHLMLISVISNLKIPVLFFLLITHVTDRIKLKLIV